MEAQDVAAGDCIAEVLRQQGYLIGSDRLLQPALQGLITPHVGQEPQQIVLRHLGGRGGIRLEALFAPPPIGRGVVLLSSGLLNCRGVVCGNPLAGR